MCVLITVRTDLPLWCFHASEAVQRESGRAANPNRWNKFNDQLKWEPTLSGLRHFNASSLRAWIKIVMTPCCLLLPIKHFAEPCSHCDYVSGSIYDLWHSASSQEVYVFTYPSVIKPKFVELTILYFLNSSPSTSFKHGIFICLCFWILRSSKVKLVRSVFSCKGEGCPRCHIWLTPVKF